MSRFVIILYNLSVCFLQIPLWKPHCFVLNLSLAVQFSRTILFAARFEVSFLSCATHILYHIQSRLSRGFAKVFEVFFETLFASLSHLARPLYYIIFLSVCQEVLQKFIEVFFWAFRLPTLLQAFVSLAHSFNIISHLLPFVNPFFAFSCDLSNACIKLKLK